MEQELEMFLREREAVTEDILEEMKTEKIDMAAIAEMGDDHLQKYVPKIGDRLAVIRFSKFNQNPKATERSSLVERIRMSQFPEDNNRGKKQGRMGSIAGKQHQAPNEKSTRLIRVGWIMNGTAIREKNGGGTRSFSISKCAKKEDILNKALDFFFPNGVSSTTYGSLSQYTYELLDYKQHRLDENFNVGDMYKMTGLNMLRFYLSTNKTICESSDIELNTKQARRSTRRFKKGEPEEVEGSLRKSKRKADTKDVGKEETNEDISVADTSLHGVDVEDGELSNQFSLITEIPTAIYNLNEFLILNDLNLPCNESNVIDAQFSEAISSSRSLTLHRGQIFEQMTDEFTKIEALNTLIEIQIIGTNGARENALDGGGVFKDALTEYWNEFYEKICVGSIRKIPEVNYMYTDEKWKAMAKIILVGYRQVQYFPIRLSKPFMEFAIFGQSFTDNKKEDILYMHFISPLEADVLKTALTDFDSVDATELVEVFSNLECKQKVNKNNIKQVLIQLAHTEILQKSSYILQLWASILRNGFSLIQLNDIYKKSEVTNKSILKLIQTIDSDLDFRKDRVLSFLKRFIRESNDDLLRRFLRFCTGADIVTSESISVEFSAQVHYHQTPSAHTCNNILVLPVDYDSYRVFCSEFTQILRSDMWAMDIV